MKKQEVYAIWYLPKKPTEEMLDDMHISCGVHELDREASNMKLDNRYTFTWEYFGEAKPGMIARFCGEWIGAYPTEQAAYEAAIKYEQERMAPYNDDIQETLKSVEADVSSDGKYYS